MTTNCVLCRGRDSDDELRRVEVWQDKLWRLTVSLDAEVLGFAYLEPKRHIASIADLDGEEAATFGAVLSSVCRALREETGAAFTYVYVFGDHVPHLHVHLAPHREGDALNSNMIRGDIVEEKLESGVVRFMSQQFPPLPEDRQQALAKALRQRFSKKS
jgi:diadenosine tetraphosphate (Ap4A) HIT family hydrolase